MYVVKLWNGRYFVRKSGKKRPPHTTSDIIKAKRFWHRDAIPIDYGVIICVDEE